MNLRVALPAPLFFAGAPPLRPVVRYRPSAEGTCKEEEEKATMGWGVRVFPLYAY